MAGGSPSLSVYNQVVSLHGRSSGKMYFELEIVQMVDGTGNASFQIGLTTDNPPASNQPLQNSASGAAVVWLPPAGYVARATPSFFNAATALAQGDAVKGAINFDTGKAWLGKVGGSWVGGGDPAAGTSETLTLGAGTWYIGASSGGSLDPSTFGLRLKTKASQFADPLPSGFSAWAG